MGPSNKSIGIGSVSMESHHPYITNWCDIFKFKYMNSKKKLVFLLRLELIGKKIDLWMESNMQYLQTKVFGYWEKINILLMSNQDQLGQK